MKLSRCTLLVSCCLAAATSCSRPQGPVPATASGSSTGPVPLEPSREGAVRSGKYRDLFAEVGLPPREVEEKLAAAYRALFHGSPEDETVMFEAGQNERGPLAYVFDTGNEDVRSEGMSYGMMIAVQRNEKRDFDALWNWAKTFMQISDPAHPVHGFFAWQLKRDGQHADEMPAPDGEEYFATALLFAAHRWGNGTGIYDYGREARELLGHMKNRQPITGQVNGQVNGGRQTTAVALFNPEQAMVRFSPDTANFETNGDHTDPSYHLPAFYEVWALWGPEADREFWARAARASRDHFVQATHPETALSPDYSNFDGTPKAASWDPHTADFRYDAWRTAMNWSVDSAWWARDPRQTLLSDRLLSFFSEQGSNYASTYTLDGKATNTDHALGLVSTNAVAALAASDPRARAFVRELYEQQPPRGKWRYYNGVLYMMALLHVSGNFRVYAPSPG
jgi:oligosaccharide reducing-end xylanase